jgi:hypothetical protein
MESFKDFNHADIASNFLCSRNQRPSPIDVILFPVLNIKQEPNKCDDDRSSCYKLGQENPFHYYWWRFEAEPF